MQRNSKRKSTNVSNGEYYYGDQAWEYVKQRTDIDLKAILEKLAEENTRKL